MARSGNIRGAKTFSLSVDLGAVLCGCERSLSQITGNRLKQFRFKSGTGICQDLRQFLEVCYLVIQKDSWNCGCCHFCRQGGFREV